LKAKNFAYNPQTVADLSKGGDPLVFPKIHPVGTAVAVARAMKGIREGAGDVRTPVLILHSDGDKVTNPKGSAAYYESVGSDDKTLRSLNGDAFKHALFEEAGAPQLRAEVIDWIEARTP
jgi:alpha-beta hydrolase superfamily lysophospholipase